jgi:hypothetical protein
MQSIICWWWLLCAGCRSRYESSTNWLHRFRWCCKCVTRLISTTTTRLIEARIWITTIFFADNTDSFAIIVILNKLCVLNYGRSTYRQWLFLWWIWSVNWSTISTFLLIKSSLFTAPTAQEYQYYHHDNADNRKYCSKPFEEVIHFTRSTPWLPTFVPFKSIVVWIVIIDYDTACNRTFIWCQLLLISYIYIHYRLWSNVFGNSQIVQHRLVDIQTITMVFSSYIQDIQCWSDHNCCLKNTIIV